MKKPWKFAKLNTLFLSDENSLNNTSCSFSPSDRTLTTIFIHLLFGFPFHFSFSVPFARTRVLFSCKTFFFLSFESTNIWILNKKKVFEKMFFTWIDFVNCARLLQLNAVEEWYIRQHPENFHIYRLTGFYSLCSVLFWLWKKRISQMWRKTLQFRVLENRWNSGGFSFAHLFSTRDFCSFLGMLEGSLLFVVFFLFKGSFDAFCGWTFGAFLWFICNMLHWIYVNVLFEKNLLYSNARKEKFLSAFFWGRMWQHHILNRGTVNGFIP